MWLVRFGGKSGNTHSCHVMWVFQLCMNFSWNVVLWWTKDGACTRSRNGLICNLGIPVGIWVSCTRCWVHIERGKPTSWRTVKVDRQLVGSSHVTCLNSRWFWPQSILLEVATQHADSTIGLPNWLLAKVDACQRSCFQIWRFVTTSDPDHHNADSFGTE